MKRPNEECGEVLARLVEWALVVTLHGVYLSEDGGVFGCDVSDCL